MSGIFAMIAMSKTPELSINDLESTAKTALNTMRHRGPDGQSTWASKQSKAVLGHVRLNIMDLAAGEQPLSAMNRKSHAVVNGEFYDYESIRNEFIKNGYRFDTILDSEILLPLYQKYGTNALSYLRGEFSFCLWDEKAEVFFAARDRFGIKPLYYSIKSGYLYVASEIKSLLSAGVEARWNTTSYTTRAFYLGDETLFEEIYQVPPGYFMLVSNGHMRLEKYWDMNFPLANKSENKAENKLTNNISEDEYIFKIREAFEESVKLRLKSNVDVGVFLSGGIDSSAVLAVAAKHSKKRLETFTLSFGDKRVCDEKNYAEISADYIGVNFNLIDVSEADIIDNFSDAIWHSETPFFNGHGVAKYLLSSAVSQLGIKVVLTGQGADEIFGGYPHYQRDMALYAEHVKNDPDYLDYMKLKDEFLEHEKSLKLVDDHTYPALQKTLGFQPSWMQHQAEWVETLSGFLNKSCAAKINANHPFQHFMQNQEMSEMLAGRHPVHQSMYLWAKSYLPNFVLKTLGDRMEMANALEGRLPYLDHHLVELANQAPVSMLLKPETTKYILREALKSYLPEEIYQRKKYYFRAPQALLTPNGMLYTYVRDTLNSQDFKNLPFFDHEKVIRFLNYLPKLSALEQSNFDGVLMEMTSLSLLQKAFNPS